MAQRIIGIVVGTLALTALLFFVISSQGKDKYLSSGKQYLKFSEYDKAIESLKKALEEDPNSIEANVYIGIAYGKKREYDKALWHFGRARDNRTGDSDFPASIYNDVGLIYYLLEEYYFAIEQFEKSIKADPGFSEAYFNLGVTYSITGRTDEAIAAYAKVLEIDPKNSFGHWNLAVNFEKVGNFRKAVEHWEKYIEYVPGAFRHPDIEKHIEELKGKIGKGSAWAPVKKTEVTYDKA
ncbi:MAG: tetratricopeptide repeat protein [Candidatus Omnitrophota bacterium]